MRYSFCFILVFLFQVSSSFAQGRKLPDISFKIHTTEFANANRGYNEGNEYTDTLKDEVILYKLAAILREHEDLNIELIGHTAINESANLGLDRAEVVRDFIIKLGTKADRITVTNKFHADPIISDRILLSLPSSEEKNAANQKNRRVEIKVSKAKAKTKDK